MRKRYEPNREIQFAAKSGFITKDIWNKFFAYGSLSWQYKLWDSLSEQKIFIHHSSKRAKDVLVLNWRHPLVQRIVGQNIVTAPFIFQLDHDELIAKIVLTLMKEGVSSAYRLEPELKKMMLGSKRHYDTVNKDKYPDGLVQLANEDKTRVALELELTRKNPKRYRQILEAYSSFKKAEFVVFILRDNHLAQTINEAMRDTYYPKWEKPIGFGQLEEWIQNPAEAKIQFSDSVTTLRTLRNKNAKMAS